MEAFIHYQDHPVYAKSFVQKIIISLYIQDNTVYKLVLVISVMNPVVDSYDGFLNNDFESWQDRPACSKEFRTMKIKITLYMA